MVGACIVTVRQGVKERQVALDGRVEIDLQQVVALVQDAAYIAAPRAMHVVGLDEALVVQVDVGVGVQPLEDDGLVYGGKFLGRRCEMRLVHPVLLIHPLD